MPDTNTEHPAPEAEINAPATQPAAEPISEPAVAEVPVAEAVTPVPDAKEEGTPSSEAGDKDANKKPSSLLDAVKSAVQPKADADSSTVETNGKPAEGAEAPKESPDDTSKDKQKPEADQKLPFHNHPRWKELVAERDSYRPDADQYRKITSFMSANGLTVDEVRDGFEVMALMKTNPAEAHKRISEYKSRLDAFVGEKLPEDLSKKVEDGYVDPETAKQYAALKAEKDFAIQREQARLAQENERLAREQEAKAAQAGAAMQKAVVEWEQQQKVRDPDWSKKEAMVTDQVKLMMLTHRPSTPDEAVQLVEQAHRTVRERLAAITPQRRPVSAPTSATSSANAVAAPQSLLEAVRRGAMATR